MSIIDLGPLGVPRENPEEIELLPEEGEMLKKANRCKACHHLSIFHYTGRIQDGTMITHVLCTFGCICGDLYGGVN